MVIETTVFRKNGDRMIIEVRDIKYDGTPEKYPIIVAKDSLLQYPRISREELEGIAKENVSQIEFHGRTIILCLKPSPLQNSLAMHTHGPYILAPLDERIIDEIQRNPGISDVQLFSLGISPEKVAGSLIGLLIEGKIVGKKCAGCIRFFPPQHQKYIISEIKKKWLKLVQKICGRKGKRGE